MHNHSHSHLNFDDSNFLIKSATTASVLVAAIIIVSKLIGYVMTDAITILASLTDSLLDLAASLINFFAVRFALQPADNKYRFGYSKAEDLAVFSQASFFCISGLFLIFQSIKRIITPERIENGEVGLLVIGFSLVLSVLLIMYQRFVISKTNSTIVKADYLHYAVDIFSNIAVIISLYFSFYFELYIIDPLFGLAIAIYIIYGAWSLLQKAIKSLLDHEVVGEEKAWIEKTLKSNKDIIEELDFKPRYAGSKLFVQFHVELDPNLKLIEAHHIVEKIENKIITKFPNCEILIHKDPAGLEDHQKDFIVE